MTRGSQPQQPTSNHWRGQLISPIPMSEIPNLIDIRTIQGKDDCTLSNDNQMPTENPETSVNLNGVALLQGHPTSFHVLSLVFEENIGNHVEIAVKIGFDVLHVSIKPSLAKTNQPVSTGKSNLERNRSPIKWLGNSIRSSKPLPIYQEIWIPLAPNCSLHCRDSERTKVRGMAP